MPPKRKGAAAKGSGGKKKKAEEAEPSTSGLWRFSDMASSTLTLY